MKKILVVDDEPDFAQVVEQQFEGKVNDIDIIFIFAENGEQALKKLEEHKDIELVLTDINMPIMDGLEFVNRASNLDRLLKIIMVSAYSDMPNIRKAMNRGAYDFVIKPVDFLDLAQAITRGLKAIDQIKADEGELKRLQEIEKEMEMVKKIQKSLLPSYVTPFLQNNSFEVFGTLAPARIMGGDFYDFFPAGRNKLAIVIGETNSIGLSAAICISSAREAIRRFANQHLDFETCVKQINDYLFCQKTEDVSKFNLFFGIFNILTGTLEYISSGLPSPLLVSNQEISELHQSEVAIGAGLSKQHDIPVNRIGLNKRESFIIYSNGLLNLKNEKNERYLLKSLQKVILANQESPLSTLIDNIVLDTRQFLAPLTQSNDYVVLSLKFNP